MKEIKFGNQIWMESGLDIERFRNGDVIFKAQNEEEWEKAGDEKVPCMIEYENNKFYNWYAVNDSRNLAPQGWRVPTKNDFEELIDFIVSNNYKVDFTINNVMDAERLDIIYFEPNGCCNEEGVFFDEGEWGCFWTNTASDEECAWAGYISNEFDGFDLSDHDLKSYGLSVRLIKDV